MGDFIVGLIVLLAIAGGIYYLYQEIRYKLDRAKNFFAGQRGQCIYCKHCRTDETHQTSSTGYFCRLSRCENITEDTFMDCMEKPTVTSEDLETLFVEYNLWTPDGKAYIRANLLDAKMTWPEIDAFLKELPKKYPHYIKPEYKNIDN